MAKEERDSCHVANNEDQNMEMREIDKKRIDGHELNRREKRMKNKTNMLLVCMDGITDEHG